MIRSLRDRNGEPRTLLAWLARILGPAPGLKELNLICWGLFAGFVVAPIAIRFWIQFKSGTGMTGLLPLDFIYFYGIGRIFDQYPLVRLYDYELQQKILTGIFQLRDGFYGPSPYPPFVAMFFGVYARFPFAAAYFLWLLSSLILYLSGVGATIRAVFPYRRFERPLIFCFSLAFYPFFISNFTNGQLASIAVFAVGLVLLLEHRSRLISSGLALSILAYKPTLLLLILPMLLLTRRFRQLAGFLTGCAVLALVSTVFGGWQVWAAYARFLRFFGQAAGLNGQSVLLRWKYVDLSSLSYVIPGGRSAAGLGVLLVLTVGLAAWGAMLLWKSANAGPSAQSLAWAATLTWTLSLNVYVPIYDAALLPLSLILTVAALRKLAWPAAERRAILLAVLTFAVSWITVPVAKTHGIQLITLSILLVGLVQLILLRRAIRQALAKDGLAPLAP